MKSRIFTPFRMFVLLLVIVVSTTSAVPFSNATTPATPENSVATAAVVVKPNTETKVTYHELKTAATQLKGSKLTFKERVALKLFGKKIANRMHAFDGGGKSQVMALILCILVGSLGIHRFYLGYIWQGVVQLLTLGGCGIWSLIDLIRIITGDLQPKDGTYEKTL